MGREQMDHFPRSLMRTLLLAFALLFASGAAAQPSEKDPGSAQLYSVVVPGGGQIYSGETLKGGVILVGVGVGLGAAAAAVPKLSQDSQARSHYERYGTQLGVGLGVAGALWLYGILDAPHAARRANERNSLVVVPRLDGGTTVAVRIGL